MSSRRFIDRGFWKCRELNQADARTRILFVYLFGEEVDDFGRVKDDPYLMKRGCFSDDGVSEADVRAMLDTLVDAGLARRYLSRDEAPLLWLPTFHDYQPMGYWAISRLDRHPDDDFEAFDWLGPNNKKTKTPRPLSPVGHEYGILANPTESDVTSHESIESDESLGPNTYTHTHTKPATDAAPLGARGQAVAVTDKDLKPFAAKPPPDAAETAAPDGRGSDAPKANSMEDNGDGAFEQAENPAEASRIWTVVKAEFNIWNGYDAAERLKATAEARGRMLTHEGQVQVLTAVFDAVYVTKASPDKRWSAFRKKLKGRGGGSPDGRKWAKGITG